MEFYLPTRDECQEIVKKSEAFYVTETEVDGYKIEMYDYRLAAISDFVDHNAFELRGLTFVFNPVTNEWERNILMNKFFNVNQTVGWMYDDVKDKKIVRVQDKLDGSVISFVKFPNGKIRAKSKMSFTSEQAQMAQEIYENNENIKNAVDELLDISETPIFELVSPENQIVLEYDYTDLVLLQIRNLNCGVYAPNIPYTGDRYGIKYAEDFNDALNDLYNVTDDPLIGILKHKETAEGFEGWVVTFEDGQMAKIKTDWYLRMHGLIGPDAFRENLLIETILNEQIDDVISQLADGAKKDKVQDITDKVNHRFNHLVVEYKKLRGEFYNKYGEDRKEFALMYSPNGNKPHFLFSAVMRNLHGKFSEVEKIAEKAVKEHILSQTNSLGKAKEYLKDL